MSKYGLIELHDLYDFNAPNAHREVVMCKECKWVWSCDIHKKYAVMWCSNGQQAEQTEPMETTDYCKRCNHKGCETCAADGSNPYCVPSRYEPKKKSCADCEYHDWEVDEHIGFRSVCNGIGKCPNKIEPQTEEYEEPNYYDPALWE